MKIIDEDFRYRQILLYSTPDSGSVRTATSCNSIIFSEIHLRGRLSFQKIELRETGRRELYKPLIAPPALIAIFHQLLELAQQSFACDDMSIDLAQHMRLLI